MGERLQAMDVDDAMIYDELAAKYAEPEDEWDTAWEKLENAIPAKRSTYAWIGRDGVTYTDYADEKPDRIRLALKTLQRMNAVLNNLYR